MTSEPPPGWRRHAPAAAAAPAAGELPPAPAARTAPPMVCLAHPRGSLDFNHAHSSLPHSLLLACCSLLPRASPLHFPTYSSSAATL